MAELLDTASKQLSSSVEFQRGMAAFFNSSADTMQRALDACAATAARDDEIQKALNAKCEECEKEKQRADKAEQEAEYWKNLALELQKQPKVIVKGQAKVKKLVAGNVTELYAKDDSNQGQHNKRVGAGG